MADVTSTHIPERPQHLCRGCEQRKPASQFYKQRGRLRHLCIVCYADYNKAQRERHKSKRLAYDRARGNGWSRTGRVKWNPTEPEKHDKYLRRTYGITLQEYDAMLAAQGFVCAICEGECNRSTTGRLCVDHDHATGEVRGLLCFQCNVGLGKFKDDPAILARAMVYLKR